MNTIKKTFLIGTIAAAFAMVPAVTAQSSYGSGTDEVVDTVVDEAKSYGSDKVKGASESYGSGASSTVVDGKVDETTAYGSGNPTPVESHGSGTSTTVESHGSGSSAPVESYSSATSAPAVSCPSGTTAQPDGSCMITGSYNYGS